MSTPIQYPLVNGVRHSYSSIELTLNGQIYKGFKSINYDRVRGRSMARGNSPDPLGKTRGDNEYSADCELFLAEFNLLISKLGAGYGDKLFTVTVTYSENGFDTIEDVLLGCSVDSSTASQGQGPDALSRKVTLNPVKIKFSGLDDLGSPLTGVPV